MSPEDSGRLTAGSAPLRPLAAGVPLWTVGHLTVDDVVFPDGRTQMETLGGAALYAALGARYAGVPSTVASRLGHGFPAAALDRLSAIGISTSLVGVDTTAILQWALYEADGSRQYVAHPGSGGLDDLSPDPAAYCLPAGAFVHIAPMPVAHQRRWCAALGGHAVTLDPHFDSCAEEPAAVLGLVPRVVAFLPSELEVRSLGYADPPTAVVAFRAAGALIAGVKLGADGSVIAAGDAVWHVPALPVTVRDVTGAGDAYCGAFAAALSCGSDALTAARWATAAASIVVETVGAGIGSEPLSLDEAADRAAAVAPVRLAGSPDPVPVHSDTQRNETV